MRYDRWVKSSKNCFYEVKNQVIAFRLVSRNCIFNPFFASSLPPPYYFAFFFTYLHPSHCCNGGVGIKKRGSHIIVNVVVVVVVVFCQLLSCMAANICKCWSKNKRNSSLVRLWRDDFVKKAFGYVGRYGDVKLTDLGSNPRSTIVFSTSFQSKIWKAEILIE